MVHLFNVETYGVYRTHIERRIGHRSARIGTPVCQRLRALRCVVSLLLAAATRHTCVGGPRVAQIKGVGQEGLGHRR
jgi:hypothetical protein